MGKNGVLRGTFLVLSLIAIAVIASALAYTLYFQETPGGTGQRAPGFTLTDLDGQGFSLSDYRGRVVLLDFMATWCPLCAEEMKKLKGLQQKYAGDVAIISIGIDPTESDQTLKNFRQEAGAEWRFARDTDALFEKYEVDLIPKLVLIDKRGYIRLISIQGSKSLSELSAEIDRLLTE